MPALASSEVEEYNFKGELLSARVKIEEIALGEASAGFHKQLLRLLQEG